MPLCYHVLMSILELSTQLNPQDFLKTVTSRSMIDQGTALFKAGGVVEFNRTAQTVRGIVKDVDETFSVSLTLIEQNKLEAQCGCCSAEDMLEFWCQHAVALFLKANELGFFDPSGGFGSEESKIRMNMSSPSEIASVIDDLNHIEITAQRPVAYYPKVHVLLHCTTDRLGVQVHFDGTLQMPRAFDAVQVSSRALDTILLKLLEEYGTWDEVEQLWYLSSSRGIERAIGIIQEYDKISLIGDKKTKLSFPQELLEALLIIDWKEGAAEVSMEWVLPDGSHVERQGELIGTEPFWTLINGEFLQLSPAAAKICSIFPYNRSITIPRTQVGPILEEIRTGVYHTNFICIKNEKYQPDSEIKEPTPKLIVSVKDNRAEHFASSERLSVDAVLEFAYPQPPKNKNIVFLPDRSKEQEYIETLKSLGFVQHTTPGKFTIHEDDALDFISKVDQLMVAPWVVSGIELLKERVRFAELTLAVSVQEAKAGEFKKGSQYWFDAHISLTQNNANLPISTLFKSTKSGASERWIRLDSGAYARVPMGSLHQLRTTLGMIDPSYKISNTIKAKLGTAQAVSLGRLSDAAVRVSMDKKLTELQNKLVEFKSIEPIKVAKSFQGKLRSYQDEGFRWLNFLDDFELGGILADEMGLGKTVQTLAFLQHLKTKRSASAGKGAKAKQTKPVLIVAPTSVITNWCYEIKRFTPDMSYLLLQGPQRKGLFKEIPNHDIIITSYALLRLDKPELEKHQFEYFIIDEAQNIKNPSASVTKAAKSIRARGRLALSGTPTENRPLELWSIIDFVMPGYLGSEEFFKANIERPILESEAAASVTKFLNSKTRPFILRRTKAEVEKDLPPKIESVVHVEMATSQAQLYAQVLEEVRPKVMDAIEKKGVAGASISILAALLRLRQICNHPNSIEALKDIQGFESGKFNLLKDLVVDALENGRKILVFSQFREMLAIMRRWMEEEKINHLYLDGTTKDRQSLIDTFNTDPNVRLFLISLKAGGTGLNLTAADTVFIYDPWWNPSVESQAVDRAHRIGQTKAVSVYRLVTENSVEQKIMALKSKKSKVVDALMSEQGLSTMKLSKTDLESLFDPIESFNAAKPE
jgi:superfamily II DNA or RNA helicase